MFVDNCAAHPPVDKLCAVKLAFLPPNTTSKLQPMDQGIIYNVNVPVVHVLRVIRMLFNAW